MKRDFLCGAKRTDNGEWIEGIYLPENKMIIGYFEVDCYDPNTDLMNCKCVVHKVIPETARRCTGLTDKNGKLLFEGDICRFTDYSMSLPGTFIGTIKYRKNIIAVFESGDYCTDLYEWESGDFEIIGNAYDTPELIGDDTT